jgi:integrase
MATATKARKQRVTGEKNLTPIAIEKAKKPGLYADGGRLFLSVKSPTQKSWVLVYPDLVTKKPRTMGLGSLADVDVTLARERRAHWLDVWARGEDPMTVRDREEAAAKAAATAAKPKTFRQCAAEYLNSKGPTEAKGRAQWLRQMQEHTGKLATMTPAEIIEEDVLAAVAPYWQESPRSADDMLRRIAAVLGWARAQRPTLIPGPWENPARLKDNLEHMLERRDDDERGHNPALSYKSAGAFTAAVRASDPRYEANSQAMLWATELAVLTVMRQHSVRGARPEEFDLKEKVWTIPKDRMKGKAGERKSFRVPLSDAAAAVVEKAMAAVEGTGSPYLFPAPGTRAGYVNDLRRTFKRLAKPFGAVTEHGAIDLEVCATIHGVRSTFKGWADAVERVPDSVSETCLAHVFGSKSRRAYARDDILEPRRLVMQAWADFVAREWVENVEDLAARRKAA